MPKGPPIAGLYCIERWFLMSILDKIKESGTPDLNREFLTQDEEFETQYPGIYEFLARIRHAGVDRKPGRLTIYYEDGSASVCLSDKDTKQCAFHTGAGVLESLEALESRLQSGKVTWKHSKRWQG